MLEYLIIFVVSLIIGLLIGFTCSKKPRGDDQCRIDILTEVIKKNVNVLETALVSKKNHKPLHKPLTIRK